MWRYVQEALALNWGRVFLPIFLVVMAFVLGTCLSSAQFLEKHSLLLDEKVYTHICHLHKIKWF